MALFDQQQQEEEQPNQIQPYGVCVGNRRVRIVQHVPYVPDVNMGRPLFRARQQPAYPVREQQHVMLQDRINQDVQHNMIQDNIAYNRRLYDDPHLPMTELSAALPHCDSEIMTKYHHNRKQKQKPGKANNMWMKEGQWKGTIQSLSVMSQLKAKWTQMACRV